MPRLAFALRCAFRGYTMCVQKVRDEAAEQRSDRGEKRGGGTRRTRGTSKDRRMGATVF